MCTSDRQSWLSAEDIAVRLEMAPTAVRRWFRSGNTPFRVERFGEQRGHYAVWGPDFEHWYSNGCPPKPPEVDLERLAELVAARLETLSERATEQKLARMAAVLAA